MGLQVHSACPIPPANTIADVSFKTNMIHLYPSFIHGWQERLPPTQKDLRAITASCPDVHRVFETRAGVLLHELVHYVS